MMDGHDRRINDSKNTIIKFVKEWSPSIGFFLTIITMVSTIVYASRNVVTRSDLDNVIQSERAIWKRSQAEREDYLQEYIKNAAASAAKLADKTAELRMKKWARVAGIRNLKNYLETIDDDDH
jgi:hypothetical protein